MQRNRIYLSDTIDLCAERGVQVSLRCSHHPLAGDCGHAKIMPASELAALCSEHDWPRTLSEIGKQLVCSRCGTRWPHVEVVQ